VDNVEALIAKAPKFRTAMVAVRHWADRNSYRAVLTRFAENPKIAEMLERNSGSSAPQDPEESVWRVWLDRPFLFRIEEEWHYGKLGDVSGGDQHGHWQYLPSENLVYREERPITTSVSRIGPPETTLQDLAEIDQESPMFRVHMHPIVGELLDPADLFSRRYRDHPEMAPALEAIGATRFLEREALHVRAVVGDWSSRDPIGSENLWVADDYDLVFDVETGVVLRLACRKEGEDFSVREMTEAVFDEPIDPAVFQPPPGVKHKRYGSPMGRLQRRLRRGKPPRRLRRA
jgi:hypothetical protein